MDLGSAVMDDGKEKKMGRDRFTRAYDNHNMVPGPAGTSVDQIIWNTEDGISEFYGTGTPPTTANTYAEGCIYHKHNASSDDTLYVNNGTYASPSFEKIISTGNIVTEIDADHLATAAGGVGPSPLIWDDAPLLDVMLDPSKGFYLFDEFDGYSGMSLGATGSNGRITYTERTDGLCANMPTIPGGVVQLDSTSLTADQGGTIQFLGMQCEPLTSTTIRMEWRCLVDGDNGQCFMGLCDDAITAPVTSGDAITVNDHVGFYRDAGTGSADWTVGTGDGASTEESDDACTSVLSTYHTYGIVMEGIGAVTGSTAKFYFDGALVFTTTDINDLPLLLMTPAFQMDADGANIIMQLDWLRILVSHATGACRES